MSALSEDDTPRPAEIMRAIQDFRHEFREAVQSLVRRDVYDANRQTTQLQINNLEAKITALQEEKAATETRQRSTRALAVGIAIPGAISFLIAIVDWLAK